MSLCHYLYHISDINSCVAYSSAFASLACCASSLVRPPAVRLSLIEIEITAIAISSVVAIVVNAGGWPCACGAAYLILVVAVTSSNRVEIV